MAFELVEEVLDHAPPDLTATERLILVVIAEQSRNGSRSAEILFDDFMRRTGVITAAGLRKAFQRLAERGIETRIAIATGKDGRAVYAVKGRIPAYQLPRFPPPQNCRCHRCTSKVSQDLLRKKEVLQEPKRVPQELLGAPAGTKEGPPGPPLPSIENPILSQDHDFRAVAEKQTAPFDRQMLIDQLDAARRKHRRPR